MYAQKIDRLPLRNVDADLLAYGEQVGATLREMCQQIRTANIRGGVRMGQASTNQGFGVYGFNGGVGVVGFNPSGAMAQASTETRAEAGVAFVEGKPKIDRLTSEIRKSMTQKYNVDF